MLNYIKKFSALKKLQPIILLSHMRANTSLFGHILGNNPEINGYYEMHIGYYSWKSFIRQKLKYLEHHRFKPNSRFLFDKVLHNEHYINCLALKNAKIIMSLREPEESISSLIKLYKKINALHPFATTQGAIEYYTSRLKMLEQYSNSLKKQFIYVDANDIKNKTNKTFNFIERELELKHPLSIEYKIQTLTGKGASGDNSQTLKQGKLIQKKLTDKQTNNYSNPEIDKLYTDIRRKIISNSKSYL